MNWYSKYILPKLLNRDMGCIDCNGTRTNVVSKAHGVILEIGFGSGYNLPFYKNVEKLYALEPSSAMYDLAKERVASANFPIEYLKNSAEKIPLPDHSIDTVVSTWVLCSIPDADKALKEIARVLKPEGKFIFVEHGKTENKFFAAIQTLITPISSKFTGNCHLDRKIDSLISQSGFKFESLEKFPESGRPLLFSYSGVASSLK